MMTLYDIFPTLLDLSGKLDKTQQSLDAAQQKVAELQAILSTKGGFKIAINLIKVPVTSYIILMVETIFPRSKILKPWILGRDDRGLIDSCQGERHKNKENRAGARPDTK